MRTLRSYPFAILFYERRGEKSKLKIALVGWQKLYCRRPLYREFMIAEVDIATDALALRDLIIAIGEMTHGEKWPSRG